MKSDFEKNKWRIILSSSFKASFKALAKKYRSLTNDMAELGNELIANPTLGTPLGGNLYEIRMAIKSKGKGKSGGARIITVVRVETNCIVLAYIYDKSEIGNLPDARLKALAQEAFGLPIES